MKIWKYELSVRGSTIISAPTNSKILTVQVQKEVPFVWVLCSEELSKEDYEIAIYGTGHSVPDEPGRYIGTFQLDGGSLVFHAFEVK